MTPLRNVHKLWVACGQQREHLQSEIFKLQMFEANIYQLSQLFTALHHCTHLVISVLQKENWPDGHVGMCPAFCASPRTHQRVIGPSSIAWWVIHLRNLNTLTLWMCLHIYSTFHDPPFCFSRQLTRCTSTGRLGTSCLVQRRTKTRPTSASTTPPRVKKPLHIFSDSRTRPPSYPSSSPSCVLQSYVIISCRFVQSYPPFFPKKPLYRSSTIFQYAFSKLFLENLKTWPHCTSPSRPLVRTEPEYIFSILFVRNRK